MTCISYIHTPVGRFKSSHYASALRKYWRLHNITGSMPVASLFLEKAHVKCSETKIRHSQAPSITSMEMRCTRRLSNWSNVPGHVYAENHVNKFHAKCCCGGHTRQKRLYIGVIFWAIPLNSPLNSKYSASATTSPPSPYGFGRCFQSCHLWGWNSDRNFCTSIKQPSTEHDLFAADLG